jgi:hypothetical protein
MRRIKVRRHLRVVRGHICEIPAHWRHIGDTEPEPVKVRRDGITRDLFGEIETICAMASLPDGAVITGPLLLAAREEWK